MASAYQDEPKYADGTLDSDKTLPAHSTSVADVDAPDRSSSETHEKVADVFGDETGNGIIYRKLSVREHHETLSLAHFRYHSGKW